MRTTLPLIATVLSALSLVTASPLELIPRDPENGCIALCGCCPCPCPKPKTTPPSSSSTSQAPPPPTSSAPPSTSTSSAPATPASGSQAEPSDFKSGEEPYHVVPSGTVSPQNVLGTWLYGYDGCKKKNPAYKGNIDEAYYDSWTMANTDGVNADINWNEAVSCVVNPMKARN